jgi:hypothetical protein
VSRDIIEVDHVIPVRWVTTHEADVPDAIRYAQQLHRDASRIPISMEAMVYNRDKYAL